MTRVIVLCLALPILTGVVGEPRSASSVRYRDDRLSVQAGGESLDQLLRLLANATGAEVVGRPEGPVEVTADFADVPLADAMRRLFGERSFSLTYERDRLRTIAFASSNPAKDGAAIGHSTADVSPTPLRISMSGGPQATLSPRLAAALGTDAATFGELMKAFVLHGDPLIRREAMREGMRLLSSSPEVSAQLLGPFQGMDGRLIAAHMRQTFGSDAEPVMKRVAAALGDPVLRDRAREVLRAINGTDVR